MTTIGDDPLRVRRAVLCLVLAGFLSAGQLIRIGEELNGLAAMLKSGGSGMLALVFAIGLQALIVGGAQLLRSPRELSVAPLVGPLIVLATGAAFYELEIGRIAEALKGADLGRWPELAAAGLHTATPLRAVTLAAASGGLLAVAAGGLLRLLGSGDVDRSLSAWHLLLGVVFGFWALGRGVVEEQLGEVYRALMSPPGTPAVDVPAVLPLLQAAETSRFILHIAVGTLLVGAALVVLKLQLLPQLIAPARRVGVALTLVLAVLAGLMEARSASRDGVLADHVEARVGLEAEAAAPVVALGTRSVIEIRPPLLHLGTGGLEAADVDVEHASWVVVDASMPAREALRRIESVEARVDGRSRTRPTLGILVRAPKDSAYGQVTAGLAERAGAGFFPRRLGVPLRALEPMALELFLSRSKRLVVNAEGVSRNGDRVAWQDVPKQGRAVLHVEGDELTIGQLVAELAQLEEPLSASRFTATPPPPVAAPKTEASVDGEAPPPER